MKKFFNYEKSLAGKILFITLSGAIILAFIIFLISYVLFSSFNIDEFLKNIGYFIKANPFISALLIGISFLIGSFVPIVMTHLLVKRTVVGPLGEVINAMEKISMGELYNELKINRKDEIGMLQEEFERMRISLKIVIEKLEKGEI